MEVQVFLDALQRFLQERPQHTRNVMYRDIGQGPWPALRAETARAFARWAEWRGFTDTVFARWLVPAVDAMEAHLRNQKT